MKNACEKLDAFFDGTLPDAEHEAFRAHLATCDACARGLRDLAAMEGLVGAHADALAHDRAAAPSPSPSSAPADRPAPAPVPTPAPVIDIRAARRRRAAFVGFCVAAAAAAAVAIAVVPRGGPAGAPTASSSSAAPRELLARAPTRPIEARLGYAPADHHRPYDVDRAGGGVAHEAIALEALAALEKEHDLDGVAAGLILSGERDRAADYLARADSSTAVAIDRAVLAMLEGRTDEALDAFEDVLAKSPDAAPALWNEGLAFRDLGLELIAADAFERVAALGEPGWSDEARARAKALRDSFAARTQAWFATKRAMVAMATSGEMPQDEMLRAQPTYVRHWLYEAVRAAPSRARVLALAPLAARLDGDAKDGPLTSYVKRTAAGDFARRAPLAEAYAKLLAAPPPSFADPAVEKLVSDARAAGQDDLVVGVHQLTRTEGAHAPDVRRLATASADPWIASMADAAEAQAAIDRHDFAAAEPLLRAAIARADAQRFDYLASKLELALASLFQRVHRLTEARTIAESGFRRGRVHALDQEYSLNLLLGDVARLSGQLGRMRAHLQDGEMRAPDACLARRYIHETLATARVLRLDAIAAKRELAISPLCDKPLTLLRADAVVNVARMTDDASGLGDLARDLAVSAASLSPGERALSDVVAGRAAYLNDTVAGEALVRRGLAASEHASASDESAKKARTYARLTLAVEAARAGKNEDALSQIASELGGSADERCALAVAVDDDRALAIARDANGAVLGRYETKRTSPALEPARLVPDDIRAHLASCAAVSVFALPPVHGMPRLLSAQTAWSYRLAHPAMPPANGPARRVVISDVEPPASLGLAPLARWSRDDADSRRTTWLHGAAATPARALAELADANEIEVHAHGLVDLAVSDASLLVLSPDAQGRYALTAADVRARALRGHPVVVLGACRAAQVAPYLHEAWSMPMAFVQAGARAVFASPSPIRDGEAAPFFDAVLAQIRAGKRPSEALRDERIRWLAKSPSSWVADVLVFD